MQLFCMSNIFNTQTLRGYYYQHTAQHLYIRLDSERTMFVANILAGAAHDWLRGKCSTCVSNFFTSSYLSSYFSISGVFVKLFSQSARRSTESSWCF